MTEIGNHEGVLNRIPDPPPPPALPDPDGLVMAMPAAVPSSPPDAPPSPDGQPNGLLAMDPETPAAMFLELLAVPGLTKADLNRRVKEFRARNPHIPPNRPAPPAGGPR